MAVHGKPASSRGSHLNFISPYMCPAQGEKLDKATQRIGGLVNAA